MFYTTKIFTYNKYSQLNLPVGSLTSAVQALFAPQFQFHPTDKTDQFVIQECHPMIASNTWTKHKTCSFTALRLIGLVGVTHMHQINAVMCRFEKAVYISRALIMILEFGKARLICQRLVFFIGLIYQEAYNVRSKMKEP
jgi:hypothetical protein